MKTSRKKFVLLFLLAGFAFLFLYNVIFLSDVGLLPASGASFLSTESPTGWKSIVATILYPVKIVLAGPMLPLINLPDPPPPFLVIGFAIYWTILALVIHYFIGKIRRGYQVNKSEKFNQR
ncbi:hypothetical protein SAMN05660461_6414 [Chitinophaga ginsengisegetis]|uniref:Uncharacterized protein n=1 Tax=Chitinophaga ginsengisegetis TaxID=393003 RepID=A0A1T5PCU8_9BACT|nr:hypothetical protein [Chitinophaga ginsengisegetis]SKD10496.1 hypothetical protein SAMN05660461_6414 [Chitinophaga ginsengisegetis]